MLTREPSVAGQFYPADANELRRTVGAFFQKPESLLEVRAVVVPHAGYIYSGPVAGKVFSTVHIPERIILMGPNHSGRGESLALAPEGVWHTPLGAVSVDAEINRSLLMACPDLKEDASAHRKEHALEVQFPFIQALQPGFRFSAICVGTAAYPALESLGHALAKVIHSANDPILLVASSDMTHYEPADMAASQDRYAIDRILAIDPEGLYRVIIEKDISMCGFAPTVAVLIACRDLGATAGRLIEYTNSGKASGDYSRVVAYAGMAIV
jgi:AmmeMemoRadiSam system protein B